MIYTLRVGAKGYMLIGYLFRGLIAVLITIVAACISIPPMNSTVSQRGAVTSVTAPSNCDAGLRTGPLSSPGTPELDPAGFRLMNWNMMKNRSDRWEEDFLHYSRGIDLLIMQEAYLTEDLRGLLEAGGYSWDMSVAFRFLTTESGVLTASKMKPDYLCSVRSVEPLIRTPKMTLVTRYQLSRTDRSLLVINIHSINFTIDTTDFSEQLGRLVPLIAGHQGPVILAGDFNTWSDERVAIVEEMTRGLQLREVSFSEDKRAKFFDHRVDHIYYRGLEYDEAVVSPVETSDHNPMIVTFRLADDHEPK